MKKIYVHCPFWVQPNIKERFPNAIFVPNERHLCVKGKGIREAIHDVHAPQQGTNWKILECTYYTTVIEIEEGL